MPLVSLGRIRHLLGWNCDSIDLSGLYYPQYQFERGIGGGQSVYDNDITTAFRAKQWGDSKTVN
jgi:hypothetical protein